VGRLVGTVTALGDGVDSVPVGARVAGVIPGMALGARTGSLAEYVELPATAVTAVPSGVDAPQAAVIGLAGVAAHDALEALSIQSGEIVLISGATGGVGSIAVQVAAAAGATVMAPPAPARRRSTSAASALRTPSTTSPTSPPRSRPSHRRASTRSCTPPATPPPSAQL
jgi:NADPH:quinone reductase-like Zn-dependent oxidoreductase